MSQHLECTRPARITRRTISAFSALLVLASTMTGMHSTPVRGEDSQRTAFSSVGRLLVPTIRYRRGYAEHYDERCSATLVSSNSAETNTAFVMSAWHCIEHYRDLSRPMVFESHDGQRSPARVLVSGDGMHADWVLLKLTQALPGAMWLNVEKTSDGSPARVGKIRQGTIMMAGYPRDAIHTGTGLETVIGCTQTGMDGTDVRSNCILQKGASGGGVFSTEDQPRFLGVISRGDGLTQSIYVPLARFQHRILPFLTAS